MTSQSGSGRGAAHPVREFAVTEDLEFPLARTVEMPPEVGYPTGALNFRLSSLVIALDGGAAAESAPGQARRVLRLPPLELSGECSLTAFPDPIVDIDTAGDLSELPPHALRPTVGGATEAERSSDDDKKKAWWVAQAKGEREKLQELEKKGKPAPKKMLADFGQHNEAFDKAFQEDRGLQDIWKDKDATKMMAEDTSKAVADGKTKVNDQRKYPSSASGDLSYNGSAFVRQGVLFDALSELARTYPKEEKKYKDAAKAVADFSGTVQKDTGNTSEATKAMTATEVYQVVEKHSGKSVSKSFDEWQALYSAEPGTGGAAATAEGAVPGQLSAPVRAALAQARRARALQRARERSEQRTTLHRSACTARIDGARVILDYGPDEEPLIEVELPVFDLEIDDSRWQGAVGAVARERLARTHFVQSLVRDAVADRLRRAVLDGSLVPSGGIAG
ncbi:hypothetical protein LZ318_21145 [Saccharopolyspora indica]|uniref:hypothetical protein n=1 Tax=Saccharopolyspora indica TaxID=1229659 RepID=UPI0022EAE13B|nr:hypothetical protein [Saccharopolyspora indica]MDA3642455.1 hypothetical protein [Saccharopolyspora indica]